MNEQTRGPEDIRQEIEETRQELDETVNALSERADVTARASQKVPETTGDVAGEAAEAREAGDSAQRATPGSVDVDQAGASARQTAGAARENPAALIAGALLLGFLLGRLLSRRGA